MTTPKIAIIGGGNMGSAFAAGMIDSGVVSPENLTIIVRSSKCRESLARLGCTVVQDFDAIPDASIILIAIKPQDFSAMANELRRRVTPDQLIISCLAGCTLARISEELGLGEEARVVRCMPNLPVKVGMGVTVFVTSSGVTAEQRDVLQSLLAPTGATLQVDREELLDAATALSGSGTGYVAYFIEHMVEAAQSLGFSAEQAAEIVGHTVLGAVVLWRSEGSSPRELREMVTSKGGTTAAAVQVLEEGRVGTTFQDAIRAAYHRSRELNAPSPLPRE